MERARSHVHGWRRWLFAGYALVTAVLVAVWGFSIAVPTKQAIEERQREGLVSVANATGVALQTSNQPPDEVLARIAASDNLRLTLIAADGTVLAESTDDDLAMDNHADRTEIQAALNGEVGVDQRVSETDGIDYLYVAVPCTYHGKQAVVRVSRTMEQVNLLMRRYRWMSVGLVVLAVAAAFVAALLTSQRTIGPVRHLEQVRTDFVANASHELKTPVAGIRLLSESIEQAGRVGDLEAAKSLSHRLSQESRRLQALVCDLMDLSRLESDLRPRAIDATCDLVAILHTSYEVHLARAATQGIKLVVGDANVPNQTCRVTLSATDASLVIDNLLENAIAYTDEGTVTARLGTSEGHAVLEVTDTGIGIPPADQERVFERFYRVDTARSRGAGGTGLGLALVRHAVERGGGTIELTSEVDKGSTFIVSLPLAP